jgi:cell division protein FtsB
MTDLNTREAESLKTISDLRRNLEQTSSKTNQQNQQALDKLRQEKMQLEQNISDLNRQLNDLSGRDSNNSLQLKNLNRDI